MARVNWQMHAKDDAAIPLPDTLNKGGFIGRQALTCTRRSCTVREGGPMLQNVTFSAHPTAIASARAKAQAEGRTLNEVFRSWLEAYVSSESRAARFDEVMASLSHITAGRHFTRDEANER